MFNRKSQYITALSAPSKAFRPRSCDRDSTTFFANANNGAFCAKYRERSERVTFHKGFTLVELLVVVLIIGLLTGVGIPAFSAYGRRQNLAHAAKQIKTDLQAAKSQAISGVVSDTTGERWGVHLAQGAAPLTYAIFSVAAGGAPGGFAYNSRTSTKSKTLPSNVSILALTCQSGESRNPANIVFDRLNGTVGIYNDIGTAIAACATTFPFRITLNLSGTLRYVRVDSGGKVYEE